jgi:drug/metabolite transporter (DMT)-like permease
MDVLPFVLVLLSAFFNAAYFYFTKKSKDKVVFIWWTFLLFSIALFFIPIKAIQENAFIFSPGDLIVCALAALFFTLNYNIAGLAYQRQDLSLIFPLVNTGPLYIPILAYLFLGEHVPKIGILGIVLICLGSYLITFESFQLSDFFKQRRFIKERAVYFAMAAGFFYAVGAIFDKIGVTSMPVSVYTYMMMLIMTVFFSFSICRKKHRGNILQEWRLNKKSIALTLVILILSTYTYRYGLEISYVSYAASLRLTSIFIAVLFGVILLRERYGHIRFVASAFIILGTIVIKFLS